MGSRIAAVNSRHHAKANSKVAYEVAQSNVVHPAPGHARQAVAQVLDNNRLHVQSSASTVKSLAITRVTAAIAWAVTSVKNKSAKTWWERRPQSRPYSNFKHRVSTVNTASEQNFIDEGEVVIASGYTANGISSADFNGLNIPSALNQSRKLLAVPGVVNGLQCPGLLVDCGSPVTLIRVDMWEQVRQPHNKLLIKQEKFQGVTRDGLRVFSLAHLKLQFGSLNIEHLVVVVYKIAHKFMGNDFFVQYFNIVQ